MSLEALPFVLLQGTLFGTTLVASRFSVGQFSPTTYIALRMALASLGYLLLYALNPRRHWPRDRTLWRRASLLGVLGTAVPMTFIVTSLQYQSSGVTSLLITAGPAVTVLFAHGVLDDERLNLRKGLGVILALSGALGLVVLGESGLPDVSRASPLGYGLVLVAMVCGSAMTVYARKYLRSYQALDVASVRMFAAALTVIPMSLLWAGFDLSKVDARGYFALGYASLMGTFAGLLLAFYVVQRFGATPAAMVAYIIPVVATLGGALVLGETITPGMLGGMTLIALGIRLINSGTPVVLET